VICYPEQRNLICVDLRKSADKFVLIGNKNAHHRFHLAGIIRTTDDSEPEPDFAIVRRNRRRLAHPVPSEVALVIEVSDSTLADDCRIKGRLYASASIERYWIINLVDRRIEVYTQPTGPTATPSYLHRARFSPRSMVPLVIAGTEIARIPVKDML
jgi:Uma2 family endonuclease